MKCTVIFKVVKKMKIFSRYVLIFFSKTFKHRSIGSNEYPQFMFWSKNKKNRYTPANPSFFYIKVGFTGVYFSWTCCPDEFILCPLCCVSHSAICFGLMLTGWLPH